MTLPSISFVDNAPVMLVLNEHDKGLNKHVTHPPWIPFHNVPSKCSNQFKIIVVLEVEWLCL